VKRSRRLAALVLLGSLALTACGDKDSDDSSGALAGGPAGSSDAEPTTSETPAGDDVDVDAFLADLRDGAESMTTAHMSMTMDVGGMSITGEGDVDYTHAEPRAAMTMTVPGQAGELEIRIIGTIFYMKIPGQTDAKFAKLDASDPNGPLGQLGSMIESMDPAKSFELYADGFKRATYLGQDERGGETLDHYRVYVDTSKVDAFKDLPSTAGIPKEFDYEIWLDDDHIMRGMTMAIPGGMGTMEMTVSDLGEDVSIEAPPASQITTKPLA